MPMIVLDALFFSFGAIPCGVPSLLLILVFSNLDGIHCLVLFFGACSHHQLCISVSFSSLVYASSFACHDPTGLFFPRLIIKFSLLRWWACGVHLFELFGEEGVLGSLPLLDCELRWLWVSLPHRHPLFLAIEKVVQLYSCECFICT